MFNFPEYKNLKKIEDQYESELIDEFPKLNYIIDLQNFYTRKEDASDIGFNYEVFQSQMEKTKDKGYNIFLMDFEHLKHLSYNLEKYHKEYEGSSNFLSKLYIIQKSPIVGIVLIQKYENNKNDFSKAKIMHQEMDKNLKVTKSTQINYSDLMKALVYFNHMYTIQEHIKILHPGKILQISVKDKPWNDYVDFTMTICDAEKEELLSKKNCKALISSKVYSKDYMHLKKEGYLALCDQVQASRIIIIRQNPYNFETIQQLSEKLRQIISSFTFESIVNEAIPIMLMSETREQPTAVIETDVYTIRDVIDEKKDTYRQLIFNNSKTEVETEVRLTLTSKTNLIKNPQDYTPVFTLDRIKNKNLVQTLDENYICSFFIKCILGSLFFVKADNYPELNLEVLVLGARCGAINHFLKKVFGDKVNVDSVEIEKEFKEIGESYFGFKNESSNFVWFFEHSLDFINNSQSLDKYDLIVIDINNFEVSEGISPSNEFFSDDFLFKLKVKI